eukprot:TRINITY_DN27706_c0_g2_i1.p1 TRINITY_DN27706_c0_g2~~TRINITY_DN27706_c0_g2_i1.p1  ORF type:complete len:719 (+),score=89.05 TRINITY_DN27706_c0_g2_i1:289-2157(+)
MTTSWAILDHPRTCSELCSAVKDAVSISGILPPASDLACYFDTSGAARCDLDMSPRNMPQVGAAEKDLPDFHEGEMPMLKDADLEEELVAWQMSKEQLVAGYATVTKNADGIDYTTTQLTRRLATLFRFYPLLDSSFQTPSSSLLQSSSDSQLEFAFDSEADAASDKRQVTAALADLGSNRTSSTCDRLMCKVKQHCTKYPYSCGDCFLCKSSVSSKPSTTCGSFCKGLQHECTKYPHSCGGCSHCSSSPATVHKPVHANRCHDSCDRTFASIWCAAGDLCKGCSFCGGSVPTQPDPLSSNGECHKLCVGQCQQFPILCGGCEPSICSDMATAPPSPPPVVGKCYSWCERSDCTQYPKLCAGCGPRICGNGYVQATTTSTTYMPKPKPSNEDWMVGVQRISQKAIQYINNAIIKFRRRETKDAMRKWFGGAAYSDNNKRKEIQRVLNSVTSMLDNVEYRYDRTCSSTTYAYVYPRGAKSENGNRQKVFYLCDLYFKVGEGEQIETLTHEGSHHATAFTDDVCLDEFFGGRAAQYVTMPISKFNNPQMDDIFTIKDSDAIGRPATVRFMTDTEVTLQIDPVRDCKHTAYGRKPCADLAIQSPIKALRNADNFCYYVQDVTDGV